MRDTSIFHVVEFVEFTFVGILRRDPEGIMPRLLIRRDRDNSYHLQYRYRPDFEEVFASLLGSRLHLYLFSRHAVTFSLESGTAYTVPRGEWRFVIAQSMKLPFGACDFFQLNEAPSPTKEVVDSSTLPGVCCRPSHVCPFRFVDVQASSQCIPSERPDEPWDSLLDLSVGFRAILRRLT